MSVDLDLLGKQINELDFDTVFKIVDGVPVRIDDEWAPEVYNDTELDVVIEGDDWRCLTGLTGQYGYHGAVMHSSELVGRSIAEEIFDMGDEWMFAMVIVGVDPAHDDPEPEPAGWSIAYKNRGF